VLSKALNKKGAYSFSYKESPKALHPTLNPKGVRAIYALWALALTPLG